MYATPVAVILLVGGLMACFAGYRLFRVVLGIYGFMVGAAVTISIVGHMSTFALIAAAIVGGLVGAALMVAAYFIGVGLVGGGLASLALHWVWQIMRHHDPPTAVLVVVAVVGALLALSVARYVVVFGTALGGSWTGIVGALSLWSRAPAQLAAAGAWSLSPLEPAPNRWWFFIVWIGVAIVGAVVQLATTTKLGARKVRNARG